MTAADLAVFEAECRQRFGWPRHRIVRTLDVSHDRYLRMLDENSGTRIPRHIALACSAILRDVPPYGAEPDKTVAEHG